MVLLGIDEGQNPGHLVAEGLFLRARDAPCPGCKTEHNNRQTGSRTALDVND